MRWLLTLPAFGALGLVLAVELRANAQPADRSAQPATPVDVQPPTDPQTAPPAAATALIRPASGSEVYGLVRFWETPEGPVAFDVELYNVAPGEAGTHGMHVHEHGDCSAPDAESAGGHYNPTDMPHGGPDDLQRHVGDLGNFESDAEGHVRTQRTDRVIQLDGAHSIIGRSMVLHVGQDDFTTQPTGDAGTRIGCGVIQRLPPAAPPTPREEG